MKVLKIAVPVLCLVLAVVVPVTLIHTDTKQPEQSPYAYIAIIPEVATAFSAPAEFIWTGVGTDVGLPEEGIPALDQGPVISIPGAVGYIYCDSDGKGIEAYVNSPLGPRTGGPHKGEDLQPVTGFAGFGPNEIFAVCPFSGTVERAGYDASMYGMGYNVMVRLSDHVTLTYMHLGYGSGKAVQFTAYTPASNLVSAFAFQNVGYPDEWIEETEWVRQNGGSYEGNRLRTVGPSSIRVSVGDRIGAGTVIGVPGDTGNSTGLHAHISLQYDSTYCASITDALSRESLADVTWYYFYGNSMYSGTAEELGLDVEDLRRVSNEDSHSH